MPLRMGTNCIEMGPVELNAPTQGDGEGPNAKFEAVTSNSPTKAAILGNFRIDQADLKHLAPLLV